MIDKELTTVVYCPKCGGVEAKDYQGRHCPKCGELLREKVVVR